MAAIHTSDNDTFEYTDEDDYTTDESSVLSDTTTLASAVEHYQHKYGRRYTEYGSEKYIAPNDEEEQERMDMVHAMWNLRLNGELFLAPVEEAELKNVLDLGTGTGILSIDIGDRYTESRVIGTDLSPIQPKWIPPNVHFLVDDYEQKWAFSEKFNLITCRSNFGCVRDWDKFVQQAFENTAPGGYLEIQDMDLRTLYSDDNSIPEDWPPIVYTSKFDEGLGKIGLNTPIETVITYMEKAGYTNITRQNRKFPIGPWPKDTNMKYLGKLMEAALEFGFEGYGLKTFTEVLGMKEAEARKIIDDAKVGMKNRKVHGYVSGYVVYGQKPADC